MNAVAALAHNLFAGLFANLGMRRALGRVRATPWQLVALIAVPLAAALVYDVAHGGTSGRFNALALPGKLFPVFGLLLAALAAGSILRRTHRMLAAAVAMAATTAVAYVLLIAMGSVWPSWWTALPSPLADKAWWVIWLWPSIAAAVVGVRVAASGPELPGAGLGTVPDARTTPVATRLAATLCAAALLVVPAWTVDTVYEPLWLPDIVTEGDRRGAEPQTSEAVLYQQPKLLDAALAAVRPGTPGRTELFYVGFAGVGRQSVFQNEVVEVGRLLDERFALDGHGIVLANHPSSALTHPFATVSALRRALETVAQKMNRDEDVLLLFLTSHGARDHQFEIELWPYRFETLTPQALARALEETGVRNAVIVVSACYSGGFVAPLASPDRLVITASRADRNSFGCSDGADWTYFGRAYFAEALRTTTSFEDAFARALPVITQRESAEGFIASEPQIAVGTAIRARLQALQQEIARRGAVDKTSAPDRKEAAQAKS